VAVRCVQGDGHDGHRYLASLKPDIQQHNINTVGRAAQLRNAPAGTDNFNARIPVKRLTQPIPNHRVIINNHNIDHWQLSRSMIVLKPALKKLAFKESVRRVVI